MWPSKGCVSEERWCFTLRVQVSCALFVSCYKTRRELCSISFGAAHTDRRMPVKYRENISKAALWNRSRGTLMSHDDRSAQRCLMLSITSSHRLDVKYIAQIVI